MRVFGYVRLAIGLHQTASWMFRTEGPNESINHAEILLSTLKVYRVSR